MLALFITELGGRDFSAMDNGELHTDKPILYFWVALIASEIAGGRKQVDGASTCSSRLYRLCFGTLFFRPRFLQHEMG
jgi:hypothetical protein